MELDGEFDDLEYFVSLGGGNVSSASSSHSCIFPPNGDVSVNSCKSGTSDDVNSARERSELQSLVAMGDHTVARKLSKKSSAFYAQLKKHCKRAQAANDDLATKRQKSKAMIANLFCEFPMVAKATGFKINTQSSEMSLVLAEVRLKLAVSRPTGGTGMCRATQQRSVAIMTQAGLRQRDKRISQLLCLQDKECIENSIPSVGRGRELEGI